MADWLTSGRLRSAITREALATVVPALVVGAVGGVISWEYQNALRHDRAMVAHSWEVISATTELLSAATDAETGQRGFIITGDPAFLEPYDKARDTLPRLTLRVRGLVADNAVQLGDVARLERLLDAKMQELAAGISTWRQGGLPAAQQLVAKSAGKATMDEMRAVVAGMDVREHGLLDDRMSHVRTRERWVVAVGITFAVLSLLTRGALKIFYRWRARRLRERGS